MFRQVIKLLAELLPEQIAYAHCDIPCGIYDPHNAQVAAHTVIRMNTLISEAHDNDPKILAHKIARLTKVKEDHAEIVKHEVRVIWGDYIKEEHVKQYPHLHELVFLIMKLASKARQEVNNDAGHELLAKVQEFAEIFYKTKGVEPIRVKSVFPTGLEIVLHK
jgi:nickel superoxide dismutase